MKVLLSLFTYFVFDQKVKIIIILNITLLAFTYPLNFLMSSLYEMILQATPSSLLIDADIYLIFAPSIVTPETPFELPIKINYRSGKFLELIFQDPPISNQKNLYL